MSRFDNYWPISNLSFLSKTLERIVASQIEGYLTTNGLFAKMQSAYRKHHSTETALLRVVNDIDQAIDNKCEAVLVLLDLSAAFDTIDHAILLDRHRIAMASLERFFVGSNHTLRIVLNALSLIRFFLNQDIYLVVSLKGLSWDHCYSRFISPLLKTSSLHTDSTQFFTS